MNATHEADEHLGVAGRKTRLLSEMKEVAKYLTPKVLRSATYDPDAIQFSFARDIVRDNEALFAHWMEMVDAKGIMARTGMEMKARNAVIAKWPVGRVGGKFDFHLLLKSGG